MNSSTLRLLRFARGILGLHVLPPSAERRIAFVRAALGRAPDVPPARVLRLRGAFRYDPDVEGTDRASMSIERQLVSDVDGFQDLRRVRRVGDDQRLRVAPPPPARPL